ncbi:hypothetical protein CKM354_000449100 [Cercospora kikuchii]|uniref:Uncharacterized protein n=1 Tax=Cercospora kikuchii TaxID=84275 RepID=A0A9P3FBD4_9PEZI|nr:uncharacterized protein CKM354_000449100 [Cercospora kikuchii]GIZ41176.1 hypothetical protein CKM354_000449100 [Cercospora kikuchii]
MKTFLGLLAASALSAHVQAAPPEEVFSHYWLVGWGENQPFIRQVTTTLVLPPINPTQKGFLKIYPELWTEENASLTGTALTLLDDRSPCWPNVVDWCVSARMVLGNQQNSVIYKPVPIGAELKIQITYDDVTKKHDHTLSVDGEIISQLPVTDDELNLVAGRGVGFRTQVECQLEVCGNVSSHDYLNTTIVLDSPDPSFAKWKETFNTRGDLKTADGGLTWTVDRIVVNSVTYDH